MPGAQGPSCSVPVFCPGFPLRCVPCPTTGTRQLQLESEEFPWPINNPSILWSSGGAAGAGREVNDANYSEHSGSTAPLLFQAVCQVKTSSRYLFLVQKSMDQQILIELCWGQMLGWAQGWWDSRTPRVGSGHQRERGMFAGPAGNAKFAASWGLCRGTGLKSMWDPLEPLLLNPHCPVPPQAGRIPEGLVFLGAAEGRGAGKVPAPVP